MGVRSVEGDEPSRQSNAFGAGSRRRPSGNSDLGGGSRRLFASQIALPTEYRSIRPRRVRRRLDCDEERPQWTLGGGLKRSPVPFVTEK